jgi:hypothetical protein
MRALALWVAAAAGAAGCLHDTEFRCMQDADCGAGGTCESVGFCSAPDPQCATGHRFSDSAGQGLSNACVPAAAMNLGRCPADHVAVGSSGHRYKQLAAMSWDQARTTCEQSSAAAYLLIPDSAGELQDLASIVNPPFWVGLDDQVAHGMFATVKNAPAMFLPWAMGEPSTRTGRDCVRASSATAIATDVCSTRRAAVCECEP